MPLNQQKRQDYYTVLVYFKTAKKSYTLPNKQALDEFLSKAHYNQTIIHYVVERHIVYVYAEYNSNHYKP